MTPADFARLASEAYTVTPDIGVTGSASRAIVRHTDAGLVVAFPGSDNLDCWEADFDIETVSVDGIGAIHRGFWQAWKAMEADVMKAINGEPVTFVGHSLGGALAICAAIALTLAGNPPVSVYGFEAPRTSPDLDIRTLLANVPVHLYKNGLDIVPDVPFDWQHPAILVHIGKPSLPFPNTLDHQIDRVIAALT